MKQRANAWLYLLPALLFLLFFAFRKKIMEGVSRGGLKG